MLVTENGAGTHGIGGGPNKCVNGYLNAYLLEGRLPERSAACAPHAEPKPQAPDRRARGTEGAKDAKGAAASKASARVATAKTVRQAP